MKPYKGTLKFPWRQGKNKQNRKEANQAVRKASKEALRKCKDGNIDAQWDFCVPVGYWD